MKKIIFLIAAVVILTGCLESKPLSNDQYSPPGNSVARIGAIEVTKHLKYSGNILRDELAVEVDAFGHSILVLGKDTASEISVFLSETQSREFAECVMIILRRGTSGTAESYGKYKYIGSDIFERDSDALGHVNLDYRLSGAGKNWECIMQLSGYSMDRVIKSYLGTPLGRNDAEITLTPDAVRSLLALVEQAIDQISSVKSGNS